MDSDNFFTVMLVIGIIILTLMIGHAFIFKTPHLTDVNTITEVAKEFENIVVFCTQDLTAWTEALSTSTSNNHADMNVVFKLDDQVVGKYVYDANTDTYHLVGNETLVGKILVASMHELSNNIQSLTDGSWRK